MEVQKKRMKTKEEDILWNGKQKKCRKELWKTEKEKTIVEEVKKLSQKKKRSVTTYVLMMEDFVKNKFDLVKLVILIQCGKKDNFSGHLLTKTAEETKWYCRTDSNCTGVSIHPTLSMLCCQCLVS